LIKREAYPKYRKKSERRKENKKGEKYED